MHYYLETPMYTTDGCGNIEKNYGMKKVYITPPVDSISARINSAFTQTISSQR